MIPTGGTLTKIMRPIEQPSRTWRLDLQRGTVGGKIDGLDAVRQAVFKVLQTERYRYDIYSVDYGHELATLIGGDPLYVQSEVLRMIREALLQDDRIHAVENMRVGLTEDGLTVRFTVATEYGSFEQEVTRNV